MLCIQITPYYGKPKIGKLQDNVLTIEALVDACGRPSMEMVDELGYIYEWATWNEWSIKRYLELYEYGSLGLYIGESNIICAVDGAPLGATKVNGGTATFHTVKALEIRCEIVDSRSYGAIYYYGARAFGVDKYCLAYWKGDPEQLEMRRDIPSTVMAELGEGFPNNIKAAIKAAIEKALCCDCNHIHYEAAGLQEETS